MDGSGVVGLHIGENNQDSNDLHCNVRAGDQPRKLNAFKKVHIIGIGGIGMSALAAVLKFWGFEVQGSNSSCNHNVDRLVAIGVRVFIGHSPSNVEGADLVAYSSAVAADNSERVAALEQDKVVMNRATLLSLMFDGKDVIAVTGTNGKTTVTSLVGDIMRQATEGPLIITGGIMRSNGSNVFLGKDCSVVLEADESDGSFLRLDSKVGIITNIADDHLDYYGSAANLNAAFYSFCLRCAHKGLAVVNLDVWRGFGGESVENVITFGVDDKQADFYAKKVSINDRGGCDFTVAGKNLHRELHFSSPLVGRYNVSNALAAIAFALAFGVAYEAIYQAIDEFRGVERRFTTVGYYSGCRVIDDYAHHPSAIKDCVLAAKALSGPSNCRVFAVIQPHRYSRVKHSFAQYVEILGLPDYTFLVENFAAGEEPQAGFSSKDLLRNLDDEGAGRAFFAADLQHLVAQMTPLLRPGDLIVFMGAGDITAMAADLVNYGMRKSVGT